MHDSSELHAAARAAVNVGRYLEGAALARRGLDRWPDPLTRVRLLGTLAYAEAELGNFDLAESLGDEALALPRLDAESRGTAHGQRALVRLLRGRRADALADFSAAIRLLSANHEDLGRNLLNRGLLYLEAGQAAKALADFEHAVAESETAGLRDQAAKAWHNAGYAAFLLGDYVRALRDMDAVADYFAGQSPAARAVGLQDRAEVLASAGLSDDAIADLRRAVALFRAARAKRAETASLVVLARMLLTENPREGLRIARRASARFAAMGANADRLRADAVAALCAHAADMRRVPDAMALGDQLRHRGLNDEAGQVMLAHCTRLLAQGRLDEAREVKLPRFLRTNPNAWVAAVRAERLAALGHRSRALASVRTSLDALHTAQARIGSLELQTSMSGDLRRLGMLGLRLALERRDPALVLEWSERARAASSRVIPVGPPEDPEQAADLAELRTLVAFQTDPVRRQELRRRIRERTWRTGGSHATQPVSSLPEVQAALMRRNATLLALLAIDDAAVALVVSQESASLHELGPLHQVAPLLDGLVADLDVAAADLPAATTATLRASLHDRLARLDALLLAPVAHLLSGGVVLTPSGLFGHIPWPLLPSLAGVGVTVARSATAWVSAPDVGPPTRTLLVAGPRLGRGEEEIDACAAPWQEVTLLAGPAASVANTLAAFPKADLVHVAAHGHHHPQNPLFSSADLADGPVFGYEVQALGTVPDIVIFSACDLGRRTSSDDPLGLATALLHSGVRTVLASPAAIADAAAARLMPGLHARLATGRPVADALAASVAEFGPGAPPLVCFGAGW